MKGKEREGKRTERTDFLSKLRESLGKREREKIKPTPPQGTPAFFF